VTKASPTYRDLLAQRVLKRPDGGKVERLRHAHNDQVAIRRDRHRRGAVAVATAEVRREEHLLPSGRVADGEHVLAAGEGGCQALMAGITAPGPAEPTTHIVPSRATAR